MRHYWFLSLPSDNIISFYFAHRLCNTFPKSQCNICLNCKCLTKLKKKTVMESERSSKIKRQLLSKSWLIREKLTEVNLSHEEITISVLSQVTCLINILFKVETRQFLSNSLIVITFPPKLYTILPLGKILRLF